MSIRKFPKTTLENIGALEKKFGLRLPQDYIGHLLTYNGGVVEIENNSGVYVSYLKEYIYVDVLFGIDTGYDNANIDKWMSEYGGELPKNTILIGDTIEHGFIVMVCSGENSGIYYWDDTRHFDCSSDEKNTYFIADTFSDFIKCIV